MAISNAELEYYGFTFVNKDIRKKEGITFEQYLTKELGDKYGT